MPAGGVGCSKSVFGVVSSMCAKIPFEFPILPKSYSKEFARGFSEGEKGYTDEQRRVIAARYVIGIQELLGKRFEPNMRPRDERVVRGLQKIVENLAAR